MLTQSSPLYYLHNKTSSKRVPLHPNILIITQFFKHSYIYYIINIYAIIINQLKQTAIKSYNA